MTPGLRRLLEKTHAALCGTTLESSNDRATAVRLKLIEGRQMKNGHRKRYYLTEAGMSALEKGTL